MMALEPRDRPAMTEVAAALRELGRDADVTTQVLSVPPPQTRPTPLAAYPPGEPPAPQRRGSAAAQPRRRRLGALPILAALLVVLLGGVIGWTLVSGNGGGEPTGRSSAGNPPAGAQPGTHRSHSSSAEHSHATEQPSGTDESTGAARSNPAPAGAPTAQELTDAITNYFGVVPADLQTGWSLLTRHFQQTRAGGWSGYQNYWNTVDHVDVTNVQGDPPHSATASLVYYYKNGQVVSQTTTFTLVRQNGVLKIAAES
jgi:hypothetical protein